MITPGVDDSLVSKLEHLHPETQIALLADVIDPVVLRAAMELQAQRMRDSDNEG